MKLISLIVPCYNEEEVILLFYKTVVDVFRPLDVDYEIIFVDDGSKDNSLEIIKHLATEDDRVLFLSFARNFGKESAMYAGFCNSHGDYVAIMDADLQDPPSLLPAMIEYLDSGDYDSVATRRSNRKGESPIRSWFAKKFYKIINRFSDTDIMDGARDFRLMNREMTDAIIAMGEYNRFSKGIFGWVGFRTKWLSYENIERAAGETKWNFWKLFQYALDGIVSFSLVPLSIASWIGFIMTVTSIAAILFIFIRKIAFGDPVAGWASTVCVIVFIGGVQLLILGIIGQYLAKTYMETKKRPHYIISDSNMDDVKKIG